MSIVLLLQVMREWDRWGWLIYIRVWAGGQGVGIILEFLLISCTFVFCSLTFSVSLFRWLESMMAVMSVFLFFFYYFLCLWSPELGVATA